MLLAAALAVGAATTGADGATHGPALMPVFLKCFQKLNFGIQKNHGLGSETNEFYFKNQDSYPNHKKTSKK